MDYYGNKEVGNIKAKCCKRICKKYGIALPFGNCFLCEDAMQRCNTPLSSICHDCVSRKLFKSNFYCLGGLYKLWVDTKDIQSKIDLSIMIRNLVVDLDLYEPPFDITH